MPNVPVCAFVLCVYVLCDLTAVPDVCWLSQGQAAALAPLEFPTSGREGLLCPTAVVMGEVSSQFPLHSPCKAF